MFLAEDDPVTLKTYEPADAEFKSKDDGCRPVMERPISRFGRLSSCRRRCLSIVSGTRYILKSVGGLLHVAVACI